MTINRKKIASFQEYQDSAENLSADGISDTQRKMIEIAELIDQILLQVRLAGIAREDCQRFRRDLLIGMVLEKLLKDEESWIENSILPLKTDYISELSMRQTYSPDTPEQSLREESTRKRDLNSTIAKNQENIPQQNQVKESGSDLLTLALQDAFGDSSLDDELKKLRREKRRLVPRGQKLDDTVGESIRGKKNNFHSKY